MLDCRLSKEQYLKLRQALKVLGLPIFPSYPKLLEAKKQCYPNNVDVTERSSRIPLQNLLDHTTERILHSKSVSELSGLPTELTLTSKWGCDGSSGHSEYQQAFSDDAISDANLFLTSVVPLMLSSESGDVSWKNPRPSSTRLCRPLKFNFIKETAEVIRAEVEDTKSEIARLLPSLIEIGGRTFRVTHSLILTMIDGKVAQVLCNVSSMAVCCISQAPPSLMNQLDSISERAVRKDALLLGLSPLHARIKCMECFLHIAYRLPLETWAVNRSKREIFDRRKKEIQEKFRRRLGLRVDMVKQGMGSSNDGNTARRFFSDTQLTADITGLDQTLLYRVSVILDAINCNLPINSVEFGKYCAETARMYVSLYRWYYMPNSMHKLLMHGEQIIEEALLPIGALSEEAQEASNKSYKEYRLRNARKHCRAATNIDVMHMMLASSDPLMNSIRVAPKKKTSDLSDDVNALLSLE